MTIVLTYNYALRPVWRGGMKNVGFRESVDAELGRVLRRGKYRGASFDRKKELSLIFSILCLFSYILLFDTSDSEPLAL